MAKDKFNEVYTNVICEGFFKKLGMNIKTLGNAGKKKQETVRIFDVFCKNNGFSNRTGEGNPNGKPNIFVKHVPDSKDFVKIVRDSKFVNDEKRTQMNVLIKVNDDDDTKQIVKIDFSDTENEMANKIKNAVKLIGGDIVEVFNLKNSSDQKKEDKAKAAADKKAKDAADKEAAAQKEADETQFAE